MRVNGSSHIEPAAGGGRAGIRALDREEGSATVEFAICTPLLVMLLLYSIFFADFTFVRLKALELGRFVAWEKTVHRTDVEIEADAMERFTNLRSYNHMEEESPNFLLGVALVDGDPIEIEIAERSVNMTGVVPDMDEDSFASGIMGIISGVLDTVDAGLETALDWFKFNTDGAVEATVRISLVNNILPEGVLHLVELTEPEFQNPFVFETSHSLVYDTWKAWPNPSSSAPGFTSTDADPMDTYRVAERMTAARVKDIAFVRLASVSEIDTVVGFISDLNLPTPLDTAASVDGGPITMLPSESDSPDEFSPSHSSNLAWQGSSGRRGGQRLGHLYSDEPSPSWQPESPLPRVDRFRHSIPFRFNTAKWEDHSETCIDLPWGGEWCFDANEFGPFSFEGDGGYNHEALEDDDADSEYADTWDCRGHFYDGRTDSSGLYGQADNWDGCDGDEEDPDDDDGGSGFFDFL